VQIHGGDSRRGRVARGDEVAASRVRSLVELRENPLGETLGKCTETSLFHLERGGFGDPKRQNNNFLDGALHFVIC